MGGENEGRVTLTHINRFDICVALVYLPKSSNCPLSVSHRRSSRPFVYESMAIMIVAPSGATEGPRLFCSFYAHFKFPMMCQVPICVARGMIYTQPKRQIAHRYSALDYKAKVGLARHRQRAHMIDEDLLVAICSVRPFLTLLMLRPLTTNDRQQGQAAQAVVTIF